MKEEDFTLYVNCRNEILKDGIYNNFVNFIKKLDLKYKEFQYYKIIEFQIEKNYVFYIRFLNIEKEKIGIKPIYTINELELEKIIDDEKISDKDKFKKIFGDFIKCIF